MATMKQPVRWMRGNIFVNDAGIPHGIWQLEGQSYGLGTVKQKQMVRARHQELYQNLTGDYALLGLVATVASDAIVEKMLEGVKNPSEQWVRECALTRDQLVHEPAATRLFFLIAPLSRFDPREFFGRMTNSAVGWARDVAGFNPTPPSDREFRMWQGRAMAIQKKIPSAFRPHPVGVSAMRWIAEHAVTRGGNVGSAGKFPEKLDDTRWWNLSSCLPEPLVDEGDVASLLTGSAMQDATAAVRSFKNRYVRVESGEKTDAPSYQQFGAISTVPQGGFIFPGSEFINIAAELPLDIDFCIRFSSTPAARVRQRNRRAERILKEQYDQQGATADDITAGGFAELNKSASSLRDYTQALEASEREVEVAATMIFSAAGPDAESAESQMQTLRDLYGAEDWEIRIPLGDQTGLFWDCWPGSVESHISREMKQITTGMDFSMGVPLTSDALGGTHGFRLGTNMTTGRYSPVLIDLGGLSEKDISGSFAALGELGSGKSVCLKTIAVHSVDRGAQLIVIDRSDNREYAALAESLTTANILDFTKPEFSLDPLRIYRDNNQRAMQETLNLMTLLLHIPMTSPRGAYLSAELRRSFEGKGKRLESLVQLRNHLASDEIAERDREKAEEIYRLMDVFMSLPVGAAFFDESLPPMSFEAQATVFCTRGLELPSEDELRSETGRREMSVPKQVGRAVYAYVASVAGVVMYADDSQEVVFLVDEAHHMTGSPEGASTIKHMLKTGRKHKGAVGLGTHAASELGDSELRGLIPQRLLFRTRDPELAAQNLEWVDPEYNVPEFIEMITKDTSPMNSSGEVPMERRGEALFRDHLNNVGRIKVMIPRADNRAHTVLTSPPAAK